LTPTSSCGRLYHTNSWSPKGANLGFYSNADLDATLDKGGSSHRPRPSARRSMPKAQRIIVQDAAHVLLYYPNDLAAAAGRDQGAWLMPGRPGDAPAGDQG